MSHLHIDGLTFSYAGHRVLTNISFVVPDGAKVGLIGENGSGKSTLLKLIAGVLPVSDGAITVKGAAHQTRFGLLHQDPPFKSFETIEAALERAVAPSRKVARDVVKLAHEMADEPSNQHKIDAYAAALEEAERRDAWEIDTKISRTLDGLGLINIERSRTIEELSGGQRARLALGWLLLSGPDVLLLDEPTNHLDDHAVKYLVEVIESWPGPVLMASHDRAFLDEATSSLIDLDPSAMPHAMTETLLQDGAGSGIGVTRFTGTYTDYVQARREAMAQWEQQYREEQAELLRLRAAVQDHQTVGHEDWKPRTEVRMAQKFYADRNAKVVSRRIKDARNRLQLLEEQQLRKPPQKMIFVGLTAAGTPESIDQDSTVFTADKVALKSRLSPTSLTVRSGEKWLITGANGTGKSTLLNILAGELEPTSGRLNRSSQARVKLFSQETTLADPYDRGPDRTVERTYQDLVGDELSEQVPLSTFGLLAPRDEHRPVNQLSLGQQRRLALAILVADPPEVLLLDEPTNHFSLNLVTALEKALENYPGTVIIASHDRWLRQRWGGKTLGL